MLAALIIYVTLVLPALLGSLRLANEVLDLIERVRRQPQDPSERE